MYINFTVHLEYEGFYYYKQVVSKLYLSKTASHNAEQRFIEEVSLNNYFLLLASNF